MRIADLYIIFQAALPDDAAFWKQMAQEERNHAAMIGGAKTAFLERGEFPTELLTQNERALESTLARVKGLIKQYGKNPPSREVTFTTALEIEGAAGELHFQHAMENQTPAMPLQVFQQLNSMDKDHARRIRSYMNANEI